MTFKEETKAIEKQIIIAKKINYNKNKITRLITKTKFLPSDKFNMKDKNLIKIYKKYKKYNPNFITRRIDELNSNNSVIGTKNKVKRIINPNIIKQKQNLIEKYKQLATIKENIGAKRSSRRKKKKRNRNSIRALLWKRNVSYSNK